MDQEHRIKTDIVLDRKDTDMLYHDFDKFKREATQLKKLLRAATPHLHISLTQCQNWIAGSMPTTPTFNSLYLAHQSQKKRLQTELQSHFVWSSPTPQLDEWFEFATFPEQRDWLNRRRDQLYLILTTDPIGFTPDAIDTTLDALWPRSGSGRLMEALAAKQDTSFSMFTEKEWRNGVLLGGNSEQKYMQFLNGCLPKLARDGGFLTLSVTQARAFYSMWQSLGTDRRAPLRVFNLDNTRASLHDKSLQMHTCWPTFHFIPDSYDDNTRALRYFHESAWATAFRNDSKDAWPDGAQTFFQIYRSLCVERQFNPAMKPDIQTLVKALYDTDVSPLLKARLATYLSHLGVNYNVPPESIVVSDRSVAQHDYVCHLTLAWTHTFTEPREVSSRLTLSEWAQNPGLSIFIVAAPDSVNAQPAGYAMIQGMLSILCAHQIKQAQTGTIQSMSKGLWLPPSLKVAAGLPAMMGRPPAPLRHHSLWGWARLAHGDELSMVHPDIDKPQVACEHEGIAVWLGRPNGTGWEKGLSIFSRLDAGNGTPGMYNAWAQASFGVLLVN